MTQLIGFAVILTLLVLIILLFRPVLAGDTGEEFFRSATSRQRERNLRLACLEEDIADLTLDHDSGKLTDEEYSALAAPLETEARHLKSLPGSDSEQGRTPAAVLIALAQGLAATLVVLALSAPGALQAQAHSARITVQGTIKNATTNQPAAAESAELLRVGQAMESLETIEHPGPTFRFRPVDRKGSPLMVRVNFAGDRYAQIIPPPQKPETGSVNASVAVSVFERGAAAKDVEFRSGLQIARVKDGLDVMLVYAAANRSKPQRSYFKEDLLLPVPDGARDVHVTITHPSSNMPVPLETRPAPGGVLISHAMRPGTSELTARFHVDGRIYHDRSDFSATPDAGPAQTGGNTTARVILWRPHDAKPDIEGGTVQPFEAPNLGQALQVTFQDRATYNFTQGSIWYENPMDSHSNPIFDEPWKSGVGIALGLTVMLLILSILAGTRRRSTRSA